MYLPENIGGAIAQLSTSDLDIIIGLLDKPSSFTSLGSVAPSLASIARSIVKSHGPKVSRYQAAGFPDNSSKQLPSVKKYLPLKHPPPHPENFCPASNITKQIRRESDLSQTHTGAQKSPGLRTFLRGLWGMGNLGLCFSLS